MHIRLYECICLLLAFVVAAVAQKATRVAAWCHNGRAPLSTTTTPKRPPAARRCGEDLTRNWQAGWQTETARQRRKRQAAKRVHDKAQKMQAMRRL